MKTFKQFITEVSSGVKDELQLLKADDSEWGVKLKKFLFGEESPFTREGSHPRWMFNVPKQIPQDIKKKYPDVVFALQALALHMGGERYFDEWDKAKKFLKFDPDYKKISVYRFWPVTEDDISKLRSGKSLKTSESRGRFSSYTRHSTLFSKVNGLTQLNIGTEYNLQTGGQALQVVTKHSIIPEFDIYYFLIHLLNRVKRVFGAEARSIKGIDRNFLHEREVIGPALSEINPEDVLGFYRGGQFTDLKEKEIEILGGSYKISRSMVEHMKNSLEKYGEIDMTLFSNNVVVFSHPEKSHVMQYAKGKHYLDKELSKAVGTDVYVGRW